MKLLDMFCGAGGVGRGYQAAGFQVVGVDIESQAYPGEFHRLDVMTLEPDQLQSFDMIHASPPCQAYSDLQKQSKRDYPDLLAQVRELLIASGKPYVIENVEGAPMIDPILLCGTMFPGLRVLRHRLFESNVPLTAPPHPAHPLVYTTDKRKPHYGKLDESTDFVQVTGGGNCSTVNKRQAMGLLVDDTTRDKVNQAIPPAYTKLIGEQLMAALVAA